MSATAPRIRCTWCVASARRYGAPARASGTRRARRSPRAGWVPAARSTDASGFARNASSSSSASPPSVPPERARGVGELSASEEPALALAPEQVLRRVERRAKRALAAQEHEELEH
jgi:hypothetical protein